jgi:hypothetical protein
MKQGVHEFDYADKLSSGIKLSLQKKFNGKEK